MKKKYKGYVFDCDGTLVNSMPAHFSAWHETMLQYGINFTESRFYELGGVPTIKIVEILAEEANIPLDAQHIAQEKEELFLQGIHLVERIDKVVRIVDEVREQFPVAVATGASQEIVQLELTQIGIYSWFHAVVSSTNVPNPKPAPDVYLEAAHQINVAPKECCAFEDTDLGIQSALSAGMEVVDIRTL